MDSIKQAINDYQNTLCKQIDIIALRERNPIAHKWKVTYYVLCNRETVAWRFVDLLEQSWFLHSQHKPMGARILLRSAIETISLLIYQDKLIGDVTTRKLSFLQFEEKVLALMHGSKNESTAWVAINIVTVLKHCEKRYKGIEKIYNWLSESAHPNYEGMRLSYSDTDPKTMITSFNNKTRELYSGMQIEGTILSMSMFENEYEHSEDLFLKLEVWLEENESELEQHRAPC
ncbi:hypothetical protein SR858_11415 [Duganella zoogloeoides]|uniref:Uncharacterized protein n=1 Tax=Duganella zoogloeoides TaxID=75659 RepID=A0ABZ0Y6B9_9BURK|nr:hypothetical protein [Duganella zoogloeoides]WQH06907.1 hypothetical protein SR858_11415 [Duganella zoogloeoides]